MAKINLGRVKGDDGVGLTFKWDGTKLGIKKETDYYYDYVDLKADQADVDIESIVLDVYHKLRPTLDDKAEADHSHTVENINGLIVTLSSLESQIENAGKVKSVNGKMGDVILGADDIEYSVGWTLRQEMARKASASHIHEDYATKKDLEGLVIDGGGSKNYDADIERIDKELEDRVKVGYAIESINNMGGSRVTLRGNVIPLEYGDNTTVTDALKNKLELSDLEGYATKKDLEGLAGGSDFTEYVVPRTTDNPKANEITVHETKRKAIDFEITLMSTDIEREGDKFIFPDEGSYSNLNIAITSGGGDFTCNFANAGGYYSYSHRKVNGDRDESGWVRDDNLVTFNVVKGDELRVSTSKQLEFEIKEIPTTADKILYFNNEAINKETDLTSVYEDISEVKRDLGDKASKDHMHKSSDIMDNELGTTQAIANKEITTSITNITKDIKNLETLVNNSSSTIKDEETTNEYEFVVISGKPYLRVIK